MLEVVKETNKQVNSQSKSNIDHNALIRQKNMIIDGLQKQLEGNNLILTNRI